VAVAGLDLLAEAERVVERGEHVAGAGGGFRLALDLQPVAARGDIDAEAVLDCDQVLVIFAEQARQQLWLVEEDLEPGTFAGLGADGLTRHRPPWPPADSGAGSG